MKYYIPTYEQCLDICHSNPPMTFYEKRKKIDGFDFSFFNYRLAEYKDFDNFKAFEMKGISFLHYNNKHYHSLMFNKFWELNQYPQFNYDNFRNKKVKRIMVKEDGNLVSFVKLPNGKMISKVKEGFSTYFNKASNEFINNNKKYYDFIDYCIENQIVPLFELVGENRIVLKYDKNDLILLNLRNNSTGEYIDYKDIGYNLDGINIIREENYTLDEIIELAKTMEIFEGWVVQFEDDFLLKVKTKWYYEATDFLLKKYNMTRS